MPNNKPNDTPRSSFSGNSGSFIEAHRFSNKLISNHKVTGGLSEIGSKKVDYKKRINL